MTVTPTRPRDLILHALGTAIVVHLLVRLTYGSLPQFPLAAGLPLAVLGVAEAIGGSALRARIRAASGTRPVQPLVAARAVLVARASALAGALMAGAWAGLLPYVAPRSGDIAAAAATPSPQRSASSARCSRRWRPVAAALLPHPRRAHDGTDRGRSV